MCESTGNATPWQLSATQGHATAYTRRDCVSVIDATMQMRHAGTSKGKQHCRCVESSSPLVGAEAVESPPPMPPLLEVDEYPAVPAPAASTPSIISGARADPFRCGESATKRPFCLNIARGAGRLCLDCFEAGRREQDQESLQAAAKDS